MVVKLFFSERIIVFWSLWGGDFGGMYIGNKLVRNGVGVDRER